MTAHWSLLGPDEMHRRQSPGRERTEGIGLASLGGVLKALEAKGGTHIDGLPHLPRPVGEERLEVVHDDKVTHAAVVTHKQLQPRQGLLCGRRGG